MPSEKMPTMPPAWAMVLGSVLVLFHFFCAIISTIAVDSGPWSVPGGGSDMALPPYFATIPNELARPYASLFKTNVAFHFSSNRQDMEEVSFEVALKDDKGNIKERKQYPDPTASSSVQFRQRLLAQQLANDTMMAPQAGIKIAPSGQKLAEVKWWQPETDFKFVLKTDNENSLPRNQALRQPSPTQLTIARSYTRYLKQLQPGTNPELTRFWQMPLNPAVLVVPEEPTNELLRRFQASYGELTK